MRVVRGEDSAYIEGELNEDEMLLGQWVGEERQRRSEAAGRQNAYGSRGGAPDHVHGARAELFAAKATNTYPSGFFKPFEEDDDVGGMEVKARRNHSMDLAPFHGSLVALLEEGVEYIALVTGTGPVFRYHGRIRVEEAIQFPDEEWTRVPSHVVPKSALSIDA